MYSREHVSYPVSLIIQWGRHRQICPPRHLSRSRARYHGLR